jgi:hypothetical protein
MIDFRKYEKIMQCAEKEKKIAKTWRALTNKYTYETMEKRPELLQKYNELYKKLRDFQYDVYAREIFNVLTELNPTMVNTDTVKKMKFREAYPNFEKIDNNDRGQLVVMIEDGASYPYEIEQKYVTVLGQTLETITMYDKRDKNGISKIYEIKRKP